MSEAGRKAPLGDGALRWSAQSCVRRRQSWRWTALEPPHPSGLCCSAGATAGMASLAACSTWGGAASQWSAQSCVPRRQSWRWTALEHPHPSGLCCSAGATAGMASLAACSTGGGGLRWSAQSCVPRRQSWRRTAWYPRTARVVWLCRRGRRHGKPGGMLHLGRRCLAVEHAVLRATPPVLAADGVGTPVPLGIMWLCRRDRRHGKPGGMLHLGRRCLAVERAVLRATPPGLAADGVGTRVPLGLCCSAGAAAGMASLAACSTQRRTRTCGTEGGG